MFYGNKHDITLRLLDMRQDSAATVHRIIDDTTLDKHRLKKTSPTKGDL